jgi:hypothetical protein
VHGHAGRRRQPEESAGFDVQRGPDGGGEGPGQLRTSDGDGAAQWTVADQLAVPVNAPARGA